MSLAGGKTGQLAAKMGILLQLASGSQNASLKAILSKDWSLGSPNFKQGDTVKITCVVFEGKWRELTALFTLVKLGGGTLGTAMSSKGRMSMK